MLLEEYKLQAFQISEGIIINSILACPPRKQDGEQTIGYKYSAQMAGSTFTMKVKETY